MVWVNLSIWYPISPPESPQLILIKYSKFTISSGRTQAGKENPSAPCRKGRGIRWLCWASKAICPTILMEWLGTGEGVAWSSLSLTQSSETSSHSVHSWNGPKTITWREKWPPKVYSKGCNGASSNNLVPTGEHGTYMGTKKLKANIVTDTNMQHNDWWFNSERETYEGDPWLSWHMPEKASGTEVAIAAAQWWDQQSPSLCPLGSTVVAEPHHADLMLLGL